MAIEQDEYGFYENEGNRRRYLMITEERAERWVNRQYPQVLDNKRYFPYRKYSILKEFRNKFRDNDNFSLIEDHIEDALNVNLPLPVRRMHYDIVGSLIFQNFSEEDKEYAIPLWKNGGGV